MKSFGFFKWEKIRKKREFLEITNNGKKIHTRHFIIYLKSNRDKRLGITVSHLVGNAVKRNRVKRLIREFFRLNKERLPRCDILIVAKRGAPLLNYQNVYEELSGVLLDK